MAVSGTQFTLNAEEIIQKAANLAGGELQSGEDLKQARMSLNLLLTDMQNRGHPLAELENKTFTTTSATSSYALSAGILDVLDAVVVRGSTATSLEHMGLMEYHNIPNKTSQGLPSSFALDKDRDTITMYLYLTPDRSTDTIDYWCLTEIDAIGSYTNDVDINKRYYPALVFGLAYFMLMSKKVKTEADLAMMQRFEDNYLDALGVAHLDDRERTSFTVTPFAYNKRT